MSRGWLFADFVDGKRRPQDGLSGAVFMMDGWMDVWVGREHSWQFIFPTSTVVSKLSAHRKIHNAARNLQEEGDSRPPG